MKNQKTMIVVPISPAELIDKICILEIKADKIKDSEKLKNVNNELIKLRQVYKKHIKDSTQLKTLIRKLKATSLRGWRIEDVRRACEEKKDFGERFITTTRGAFKNNEERIKIWKQINSYLNAEIVNEKSYKD